MDESRLCKCKCGSIEFRLEADRNGAAHSDFARVVARNLICDSAKYWNDAKSENWVCVVCQGKFSQGRS